MGKLLRILHRIYITERPSLEFPRDDIESSLQSK